MKKIFNKKANIVNDMLLNKNDEKYKIILIGSGSKIFESNSISIAKNPNLCYFIKIPSSVS